MPNFEAQLFDRSYQLQYRTTHSLNHELNPIFNTCHGYYKIPFLLSISNLNNWFPCSISFAWCSLIFISRTWWSASKLTFSERIKLKPLDSKRVYLSWVPWFQPQLTTSLLNGLLLAFWSISWDHQFFHLLSESIGPWILTWYKYIKGHKHTFTHCNAFKDASNSFSSSSSFFILSSNSSESIFSSGKGSIPNSSKVCYCNLVYVQIKPD